MDQFIGLTIISLSILGLASIGNIVIALTKPLPIPHSLDNMLAFHKGWINEIQNQTGVNQ